MTNPDDELLDETYDAVERLYHDGDVDMVIPDDPTRDAEFELTERKEKQITQRLRNDDDLVLRFIAYDFMELEPDAPSEAYTQQLLDSAEWMHERSGVNIFRVLERNPDAIPSLDVEALPDGLKEKYDG